MVEQFGLATIFLALHSDSAEGLTSGTTKGISSSYLNSEVLSITIEPALAAIGAKSLETEAPAEKKAKSIPLKSKLSRSTISRSFDRKLTFFPNDRLLAKGVSCSTGKARSSRMEIIDSPTIPVAPTTATLNFFIVFYGVTSTSAFCARWRK